MATRTCGRWYRSTVSQQQQALTVWQQLYDELKSWFWLAIFVGCATVFGNMLFLLLLHELNLH